MQTLSADRERRQANAIANPNATKPGKNSSLANPNKSISKPSNDIQSTTESRLDQLLRMSKQKPQRDQNNNQTNRPFRGRNQNANGKPQNSNVQGNGYDRNRTNTYHNNYHNNNNQYSWRDRNQNQYQSNQPSEAQLLQKELMKDNDMAINNNAGHETNGQSEKEVILPNRNVSILQLSSILRIQKEKLVRVLRELGESPPRKGGVDQDAFKVDVDMAELVAMELGLEPTREKRDRCSMEAAESRMRRQSQEGGDKVLSLQQDELYETYPPRPPVVCIMGHVDHGKTTLMDCLRRKAAEAGGGGNAQKIKKKSKVKKKKGKGGDDDGVVSNVAGTEAGGITQVVSAFQIQLPGSSADSEKLNGNVDAVTFLDTPGHAAFKAMRQSGSNGADVIVLVVAADDGVSPQTVEIIDMYKSIARAQPGSISMVVAMTKIDKPGIDIEESMMKIENQLMEHEIFSERMALSDNEFDPVPIFPLSGMTGEGLGDMIEGLILQSEVMDLRACKDSRAEGLIIDAKVSVPVLIIHSFTFARGAMIQ
jgi:small GTP-binding protein